MFICVLCLYPFELLFSQSSQPSLKLQKTFLKRICGFTQIWMKKGGKVKMTNFCVDRGAPCVPEVSSWKFIILLIHVIVLLYNINHGRIEKVLRNNQRLFEWKVQCQSTSDVQLGKEASMPQFWIRKMDFRESLFLGHLILNHIHKTGLTQTI